MELERKHVFPLHHSAPRLVLVLGVHGLIPHNPFSWNKMGKCKKELCVRGCNGLYDSPFWWKYLSNPFPPHHQHYASCRELLLTDDDGDDQGEMTLKGKFSQRREPKSYYMMGGTAEGIKESSICSDGIFVSWVNQLQRLYNIINMIRIISSFFIETHSRTTKSPQKNPLHICSMGMYTFFRIIIVASLLYVPVHMFT